MTRNKTPLLHIQDLSLHFGNPKQLTVNKVNLTLNASETLALVGESGSGKSLTAAAIMCLLPTTAQRHPNSRILLQGEDLLALPESRMCTQRGRRIGLIFQDAGVAFNPVFTLGQQLLEALAIHTTLSRRDRLKRAHTLLKEVGIQDTKRCFNSYPHELSGGQLQRTLIAMTLAGEPELLIADEPTTALDVTLQAQILQLLRDLQQRHGMGLLFITHDLNVVKQIADRVAVMQAGCIVEQGTLKQCLNRPKHAYTKQLLAAASMHSPPKAKRYTTQEPLLQVKHLSVQFPLKRAARKHWRDRFFTAVNKVSFDLYPGETLALVGESGSGKTTTGNAILRLAPTSGGHIHFANTSANGHSPQALQQLRRHVQVVLQNPFSAMNPRMTIGDILSEGLIAQGRVADADAAQERVIQALRDVELDPDCQHRYPHAFSGGQRQRICIARALVLEPQLIICDEPTSALDVSIQAQILDLMQRLQQERGLSYLLITHDFAVVSRLAHRVAVMHQGKIVEIGPTKRLLNCPQHHYTQRLLASCCD